MADSIRPISAQDHEQWLVLWHGYQKFYRAIIPSQVTDETWRRLHDRSEPMAGAVALSRRQEVIGFVHLIEHRSCWTVENYCYLQDLFVSPDFRGSGTGRALIDYAYAWAAARGCAKVYWLTHETNATARQLYDRVADRTGFLQYGKTLTKPL
jgi:GNAT superfamily N-acetyltransferase